MTCKSRARRAAERGALGDGHCEKRRCGGALGKCARQRDERGGATGQMGRGGPDPASPCMGNCCHCVVFPHCAVERGALGDGYCTLPLVPRRATMRKGVTAGDVPPCRSASVSPRRVHVHVVATVRAQGDPRGTPVALVPIHSDTDGATLHLAAAGGATKVAAFTHMCLGDFSTRLTLLVLDELVADPPCIPWPSSVPASLCMSMTRRFNTVLTGDRMNGSLPPEYCSRKCPI